MYAIGRFEKYEASPSSTVVKGCNLRLLDAEERRETAELRFFGWAIAGLDEAKVEIVVRHGSEETAFPVSEPRPDVARTFGAMTDPNCGFHFAYPLQDDVNEISLFARSAGMEEKIGRVTLTLVAPAPAAEAEAENQDADAGKVEDSAPPADVTAAAPAAEASTAPISGKAIRGKNDFLFLGGADTNGFLEHMTGLKSISGAALNIHKRNLAILDALPCPHALVVVPEAHIVYDDLLPEGVSVSRKRPIASLLEMAGDKILYPLELMRDLRAKGVPVYTGNDSHWSEFAAGHVYDEMRRRIGRTTPMSTFEPSLAREVMDLRVSSPEEARAREIEARKSSVGGYVLYFSIGILNHGNLLAFYNKKGKGRALAFGTSFTTRLAPFYCNDFEEVIVVYGTTVDELLIQQVKPDVVFVEMPERFVHFPAMAVRGSNLISALVASRAEGYEGPNTRNFDSTPLEISDAVLIARDIALSPKDPAKLSLALERLRLSDPAVGRTAENVARILPKVSNPLALRTVISGQYTNAFMLTTLLLAIERGELDDASIDIFPPTEMGMIAQLKLRLRQGDRAAAKQVYRTYIRTYGVTPLAEQFRDEVEETA